MFLPYQKLINRAKSSFTRHQELIDFAKEASLFANTMALLSFAIVGSLVPFNPNPNQQFGISQKAGEAILLFWSLQNFQKDKQSKEEQQE
ncbi:hypothetical protein Glo7428_0906 [Gloeocapsa sp. PCC 7428]|uniref:hypothetical protein n=1 Tax=Gloeocapsa sp. PCC 7428 TaxID=1173026 RepID=UPI0002A5EF07|nr:hypothetical protein [Gloeocapsa sp. PCC 7428]AFZ29485.1 hypothetical protein Glo7428_0906 [Gloeocapsa sp. PCC 7428]